MKLIRLANDEVFYRYLTPRWAYKPLSGEGAAMNGGRFNRPGVEALYLAAEPETALAEMKQGSSLPPPATLAAYLVNADEIVDFSGGYDPAIGTSDWADWGADWKHIARIEKKTPPSWILADAIVKAGHRGLLFPSTRNPGGTNLVLFSGNLTASDRVRVHDPHGDLPEDQSSWPKSVP